LALWDLLGKIREEPVYALLGGAVRDELVFYATGARPDVAQKLGFLGGKMPLQHGPAEGEAGLAANLEKLSEMRNRVGDEFWLMWDCWMSLNLDYATRLAHRSGELGLRWIEEALPPDDYWGYADLRKRVPPGMLVTRGEHRYHLVGSRGHHQELRERTVVAGHDEVVAVHAGAVRDCELAVRVGQRGDPGQLGDPAAPATMLASGRVDPWDGAAARTERVGIGPTTLG